MNLKEYDGKYIQLIDRFDNMYEGICEYNSIDYNFHEYGKNEDGLQILGFLFFKSIIKSVKVLGDNEPFGHFTEKYGQLEEEMIKSGSYFIEDAIDYGYDDHIYRLLLCLDDYLEAGNELLVEENDKTLPELLDYLIKYNNNEDNINKAKELQAKYHLK